MQESYQNNILTYRGVFCHIFLQQDQVASEVYQLYEATKYVCEMGPIDAVSGKSQFSINDQEMLETQIDFSEMVSTSIFSFFLSSRIV